MKRIIRLLKKKAHAYYRYLFPTEIEKPPFVKEVLESVYRGCTVDWNRVKFYYGLPWLMRFAYNEATTQPATYSSKDIHVYFNKKYWAPYTTNGLSTIVHEAFHAIQYQQIGGGRGIGYFRLMLVPYLSGYCTCGRGRKHLIERDAYGFEDEFRSKLIQSQKKLGLGAENTFFFTHKDQILTNIKAQSPDICPVHYHMPFWEYMVRLTPGMQLFKNKKKQMLAAWPLAPWIVTWYAAVFSLCLSIAILKPIIEAALMMGYGFLLLLVKGARLFYKPKAALHVPVLRNIISNPHNKERV